MAETDRLIPMLDEIVVLVEEFSALGDESVRMDAVVADLASGAGRFARIDPWTLAEHLGLDPDDNDDWGRSFYAYRTCMEDLGEDQPCAENVELLEREIPKSRFAELKARAATALKRGRSDMRLRKGERRLMEEKLTVQGEPSSDLVHISTVLETPSGEYLEFEGLVGDGGEVCELYGPYELGRGEGVDLDDYVCIG